MASLPLLERPAAQFRMVLPPMARPLTAIAILGIPPLSLLMNPGATEPGSPLAKMHPQLSQALTPSVIALMSPQLI